MVALRQGIGGRFFRRPDVERAAAAVFAHDVMLADEFFVAPPARNRGARIFEYLFAGQAGRICELDEFNDHRSVSLSFFANVLHFFRTDCIGATKAATQANSQRGIGAFITRGIVGVSRKTLDPACAGAGYSVKRASVPRKVYAVFTAVRDGGPKGR